MFQFADTHKRKLTVVLLNTLLTIAIGFWLIDPVLVPVHVLPTGSARHISSMPVPSLSKQEIM